jgi:type I restriction enzyme S subunit
VIAEGNSPNLPKGWVFAKIGDVLTFEYGKGLTKGKRDKHGKLPVFGSNGIVGYHSIPLVKEPCLIVGRKGSVGCVYFSKVPCWPIDTTYYIIPPQGMHIRFLYYYLSNQNLKSLDKSTAIPGLNRNDAYSLPIPLPPLLEQHRIVAKIEELFSDLDSGVEALKKAKAQLKLYRQTVLKAAFEGRLTAAWRETHEEELEPATEFLQRIKAEKKRAGLVTREYPPVDASNLSLLPKEWIWVRLGEIIEGQQYGTSEKAGIDSSGVPVIRMGNIQDGKIVFDNLKYFPSAWPDQKKFILSNGDVLFNRTNSAELVGKTAAYKEQYPKAVFASYLIRVVLNQNHYLPNILSLFINSAYGRNYIKSVVTQQVGQANVNGTKLSMMPIPLFSLSEQRVLLEEIERCFSLADAVDDVLGDGLRQSDHLRQSILKKAFAGDLVPQDPEDEPAAELLERIKTEKGGHPAGRRSRAGIKRTEKLW